MTTVAVCLAATVLLFTTASADATDEIDRARALEADGRVDVAVEHLRAVLTDDSRGADPAILLELARLTDDAAEALVLTDEVLRSTNDSGLRVRAYMMRGDYLYVAGQYALAAVEYAAAAERGAPEHPALRRAASLLAAGDIAGAMGVYDHALASDSDDVAAWAAIGRGRALVAGGDEQEALDELERVAEELVGRPVRAHALAAAADAGVALGDLARARELLRLLSAEFPGTFEATLAEDRVRWLDGQIAESERSPEQEPGAATPGAHAPELEGE